MCLFLKFLKSAYWYFTKCSDLKFLPFMVRLESFPTSWNDGCIFPILIQTSSIPSAIAGQSVGWALANSLFNGFLPNMFTCHTCCQKLNYVVVYCDAHSSFEIRGMLVSAFVDYSCFHNSINSYMYPKLCLYVWWKPWVERPLGQLLPGQVFLLGPAWFPPLIMLVTVKEVAYSWVWCETLVI